MPRKPRVAPAVLPPLERIAQQLCAMPRVPYVHSSDNGRVALEGLPDSVAFSEALKALRLERCDKAKLDEALALQRNIEEQKERLVELMEQVPRELV